MINWLYHTSIEVTLLIGLVLILRPVVRRVLGAKIAYWLWVIPLLRSLLPEKPELPQAIIELSVLPNGSSFISILPSPDIYFYSSEISIPLIWAVGFIGFILIRLVSGYRFSRYLKAKSNPLVLPDRFNELLAGRKQRQFLSHCLATGPFVTGLIKPKVYLPENFFRQYEPQQQLWIVKHELAHLQRKDLWVQCLAEFVRALFWFNPLVHYAARVCKDDQELACDQDLLSKSTHQERFEYGSALAKSLHAYIPPAAMAFFNSKKERFIMLKKHQSSLTHSLIGGALCLAVGVFALTKAPAAIAEQGNWTQEALFFHYEGIPLNKLVAQVFDFADQEVVGLEQLSNHLVSANVKDVKPEYAAKVLLECYGYSMEQQGDHYRIIQLEALTANAYDLNQCVNKGLN